MDTAYARCIDNRKKMQQDCLEHGNTTTRVEVVYGKKYIVVSHYAGKKISRKSSAITLSNRRLRKRINPHNDMGVK